MTAVCAIALAGGCRTPDGELQLLQPQLSGAQRESRLLSTQVTWALDEAGKVSRVVARFPLPGAMSGSETYVLYLQWPEGKRIATFEPAADFRAAGFFIQLRGRLAGLTFFNKGHVVVEGTSTADNATRRLKLDIECEDGSIVKGELLAQRTDWSVQRFERAHAADINALPDIYRPKPATQPANAASPSADDDPTSAAENASPGDPDTADDAEPGQAQTETTTPEGSETTPPEPPSSPNE